MAGRLNVVSGVKGKGGRKRRMIGENERDHRAKQ